MIGGSGYALIGVLIGGAAELIAWGIEGSDDSSDQPLYSKLWDRLRPVRQEYAAVLLVPMRYGRIDIRAVEDIRMVSSCWPYITRQADGRLTPEKMVR
jgi:hypothetical protein